MRHIIIWLVLFLTLPAFPEPGVAVVYDPRQPGQAVLAERAKAFLTRLVAQNGLADHQFSLRAVDVATPEGRRFYRTYELTGRDLPALACYYREGNRLTLRSLVRAFRQPLTAAETAFERIKLDEPRLIGSTRLFQGPQELTPSPCVVTIQSPGAVMAVSLDGVPVGSTPLTLQTTAGVRRLTATAPGFKTLAVEFRPRTRTQLVLQPTRARVRVGLGEVTADGYLMGRGFDSLPFPTSGVELKGGDYSRQLRGHLERADLPPVAEAWDCALNLDVNAWETWVKAELTILDRDGRLLHTLVAERGLPLWAILSEQGAARQRSAELVDELSAEAARWILENVAPSPLTEEEQRASLRVE